MVFYNNKLLYLSDKFESLEATNNSTLGAMPPYYRQFPNKFTNIPTTDLPNNISTTKTTPNNTGVARIERHTYFDVTLARYHTEPFLTACETVTTDLGGTFEYRNSPAGVGAGTGVRYFFRRYSNARTFWIFIIRRWF